MISNEVDRKPWWQALFALFRLWLDVMLWWMIGCGCVTIRDTVTVSVTGAVCDVWQDWDQSQLYNFSWSSVPTLGPRCSTSPSHLKISLSRWTGRALSVLSGQTGLITPHTNTKILTRTCSNFGYYWENYNWFSKMSTSDYGPSLFDALFPCELCRALCCEAIVPENSPIFSCSRPKSSFRQCLWVLEK